MKTAIGEYMAGKKLMDDNNIHTQILLEINGCDKAEAALKYMRDNYGE